MEPTPSIRRRIHVAFLINGIGISAVMGGVWTVWGMNFWRPRLSLILILSLALPPAVMLLAFMRRLAKREQIAEIRAAYVRPAFTKIATALFAVFAAEFVLCGLAIFFCIRLHHRELSMPLISLVVSGHFLPLARVFRAPIYFATGIVVIVVTAVVLMTLSGAMMHFAVGAGMGMVLWLSAAYTLWSAPRLSDASYA